MLIFESFSETFIIRDDIWKSISLFSVMFSKTKVYSSGSMNIDLRYLSLTVDPDKSMNLSVLDDFPSTNVLTGFSYLI
jgi:hypothetical protein